MKILTQNINGFLKPHATTCHAHEFWQLDYYFETDTRLKVSLDGVNDYLDASRAALIPPGRKHCFESFTPCRISTVKFNFDDNTLFKNLPATIIPLADCKDILDQVFINSIADDKLEQAVKIHYLYIMALRVLQGYREEAVHKRDKSMDSRLNEAIFYIKRNLTGTISLEKLAAKSGMSVNHFVRIFRKELGMTPMHYVKKLIIRKAIELMGHSDLSLEQISEMLNFSDHHTFSRSFRRETGFPPGQYRKMQKEPLSTAQPTEKR
ncbi:MAG: AraC family transcriptional regulator [Victivallaceae bacterium]